MSGERDGSLPDALMPPALLTDLRAEGESWRVSTAGTEYLADRVVLAAGPWNIGLAQSLGHALPVRPVRHQLLVTAPATGVEAAQPCVCLVDANLYVRPDGRGLLCGAYEPDPVFVSRSRSASSSPTGSPTGGAPRPSAPSRWPASTASHRALWTPRRAGNTRAALAPGHRRSRTVAQGGHALDQTRSASQATVRRTRSATTAASPFHSDAWFWPG